jgi:hypothetical protein
VNASIKLEESRGGEILESGALRSRKKKNDFGILIASFLVGFFVLYWGMKRNEKAKIGIIFTSELFS